MTGHPRRDNTAALTYEQQAYAQGYRFVAGLDEAGYGPWAGPVVAAAVILPPTADDLTARLKGVRDSKQTTKRQRETLAAVIKDTALAWGVGSASVYEIEQYGLAHAVRVAFERALADCEHPADYLLIDYVKWPQNPLPKLSIKQGDSQSLSIAAASILAKTWRDAYMVTLHEQYPAYAFDKHKGYGTSQHQAAIERFGIVEGVHRRNCHPIMQARLL